MATKPSKTPAASSGPSAAVARTRANRKQRLLRAQKAQPNNKQIANALLEDGTQRKASNQRQWSHGMRRLAELFKFFGEAAPKELFSNNPKVQQAAQAAQAARCRREHHNLPKGKVDFSLGARANVRQVSAWN
jgi:NAD(P)H-dependent FMN reductase